MITDDFADKDPDADVDRTFDFTAWITSIGGGATMTAATWASTPSGLTISNTSFTSAGLASARIAGGTAGTAYTITCTATATGSRIEVKSARLLVRDT